MKAITALTLFAGLFFIAGCGETSTDTPTAETPVAAAAGDETTVVAAVNEICPIMGNAVTDNGGRSDWEGQTVGFCCPGCIKKWDSLSDEEKTQEMTAANPVDQKAGA